MGDVTDQAIELIAFNCFHLNPHYHYRPPNNNARIFMYSTLVDDSLGWVPSQFNRRKSTVDD